MSSIRTQASCLLVYHALPCALPVARFLPYALFPSLIAQVLTKAAYAAARFLRLPTLIRRVTGGGGAVVLCYHNVLSRPDLAPNRDPGLHMDLARFQTQMRWLRDNFEVVSLDVLVRRIRDGASLQGLVSLTFDDAYVGFFKSALPVLRSLGLSATVFLVSEGAERCEPYWWDHPTLLKRANPLRRAWWLTSANGSRATIFELEDVTDPLPTTLLPDLLPASWETIRSSLGPDVTIGAHTCSHRSLPTLSASDLRAELENCARDITSRLSVRPRFLAYPYGAWNAPVREAAREAGYDAALTLDAARVRTREADLFALPRVNVPASIPQAAFEAWASGLLPR